jgi:outer membrane autotransporter protein
LHCGSVLALAVAAQPAFAVLPPIALDINGQDFPTGFSNGQTLTGRDIGIRLRNGTITQGLHILQAGDIRGDEFTGVEAGTGLIINGGFHNAGRIRGGTQGVHFRTGSQLSGGFINTGTIEAGFLQGAGSGSAITGDGRLVTGLGGPAGFGEIVVPRNDDGSTQYSITPVMQQGMNFFGLNASQIWLNTNGNITFNQSLGTFTPSGITGTTGIPLIAAFWADVDTRTPANNGRESAPIYLDLDTVNDVITITWSGVNYFSRHGDKQNFFQMQIYDRGNGDFDIVYRYQDIQWTTGDASGGSGGLGGVIARAGFTAGDGQNFFELPQSGNQAGILDLENALGNTGVQGLWVFQVRDGLVADLVRATGVLSEAAQWSGRFFNSVSGVIRGRSAGVDLKGQAFAGDFDNEGRIEGGVSGIRTGVAMDYQTITGTFRNKATGVIRGGGTGASLKAITFTGDAINEGQILGSGLATGLKISASTFNGAITNAATGVLKALSKALHLEIGTLSGPATNAGLIEATSSAGTGVQLDGFGNPPSGTHQQAFVNSGTIKGGSGAQGKGVAINAALPQGFRNTGTIQTGGIAIDHTGPGDLTYTQEGAGARTIGDIKFANAGADRAIFKGGVFDGDLLGAGANDRVTSDAGGGTTAFVAGTGTGLDLFEAVSGRTLLGTAQADTNGAGFDFAGLRQFTVNGEVQFDDDTAIATNAFTMGPASILSYFLTTDTTKHATIAVRDPVVLDGGLRVFLDPASFAGSTQTRFVYDGVLTSDGGITGVFDTLTAAGGGGTAFTISTAITPLGLGGSSFTTLSSGGSSLAITVSRIRFGDIPGLENRNNQGIGGALETIFESGNFDSDLQDLFNQAGLAPIEALPGLFDALSGSVRGEMPALFARSDDPFRAQVAARISAQRNLAPGGCSVASLSGDCFARYAQAESATLTDSASSDPFAWLREGFRETGKTSVWGRAVGVFGSRDASPEAPGSDQTTYGFIAGADHAFEKTFLAGVAAQWTRTETDFDGTPAKGEIDAIQAGGYFSWGDAALYINGSGSVTFSDYTTERFIPLTPPRRPRADYDAITASAAVEFGTILEMDGFQAQPVFGLAYAHQWIDSYRETNAGGLGLIVSDNEQQSLASSVGLRVSRRFEEDGVQFTPEVRAQWRHEFLDVQNSFEARFIGAPAVPFTVRGGKLSRDSFVYGAGITAPVDEGVSIYADYEGTLSADTQTHIVSAGLRMTW